MVFRAMNKIILSFFLFLLSSMISFGQYSDHQDIDVTTTKEYKAARTTLFSGVTVAGVSSIVWLGGSVACIIEQNKYTNSHTTSGTIEEIYNLNQEAKQQPAYKRAEAFEIGGFVGMIAGAGVIWLGGHKMKKLKNAAGQTVATFEYVPIANGISLALRF